MVARRRPWFGPLRAPRVLMLLYCELLVMLGLLALLARRSRQSRWQHHLGRHFARLARRRGLAVLLVGLVVFGGSGLVALLWGWPEPHYTDEFSYLLAADTFAHGRLATPPHPFWPHFENFHIIHQPTYASQYPPAQGLFLAAGEVLTGRPIIGVWLSLSLACMAMCWMMQAWLPPRWALFGALLAAIRLTFWGHPFGPDDLQPGYWSQGYFGGAVAAGGGALLFGALRRTITRPRVRHSLLLGLGLALLANSRPYEGLVCSLPAAALMLAWLTGKYRPTLAVAVGRVILPLVLVLGPTFVGMAYYNACVTGSPLTMPYMVHEAIYASTPAFLWQSRPPVPNYRHPIMAENYLGWYLQEYEYQQTTGGLFTQAAHKCGKLLGFYLGMALLLPLVMLRRVLRNRWMLFAALTCLIELLGFLLATGGLVHYVAPVTSLVFVLAVQALRQVRLWRWHGMAPGRAYVWALLVSYVLLVVLSLAIEKRPGLGARHLAGPHPGRVEPRLGSAPGFGPLSLQTAGDRSRRMGVQRGRH